MNIKKKIQQLTKSFFNETVEIRRHIHKNPELSFKEFKTSEYVKSKLNELDIPYRDGFVKTGIVADIEGKKTLPKGEKKRVIALRADMDALPVEEENNIEYKSVNKGVMHACGHDAHTASLLGVAKVLKAIQNEFYGTVRLIFQPGEELCPGGANLMLQQGALSDNEPDFILAQHVFPELETGTIGFKHGMYMASTDEIYITIKGEGGHAAIPHNTCDTVLTASHIVVALQQIVSRRAPVIIPTVLSFGKIETNGAGNVIPAEVKIFGTLRTMNEEWRDKARGLIRTMSENIANSMGAKCEVNIKHGYPFLINNEKVTNRAIEYAESFIDKGNIKELSLRMTGEDFAYFAQKYPATLYRLGVKKRNEKVINLHSSVFNIDEEALKTGVGVMAWLAFSFLTNKQ